MWGLPVSEFFSKLGIGVDSSQAKTATSDLDKLAGQAGRTEAAASSMGRNVGIGIAAASAAITGVAYKIISATSEQQAAIAQLEAGLASTGNVVGKSVEELTAKAAEFQKVTTFGDEEIVILQSKLLSFTNITGETFDKATASVLNLATRMGGDLNGAVVQVGKALNDPVLGVTALGRAGIQFNETQKEMIKSLAESGDLLGAQKVILKELEVQFGGSARAARDTLGGAIKGLKNAFDDLFEAGGSDAAKNLQGSIESLTSTLQDPAVIAGAAGIASSIVSIVNAIVSAPGEIAAFTGMLRDLVGAELFGSETTGNIAIVEREIEVLDGKLKDLINTRNILSNAGLSGTREGFLNNQAIEETTQRLGVLKAASASLINEMSAGMKKSSSSAETLNTSVKKLGSDGAPAVAKLTDEAKKQDRKSTRLNSSH